MNKHNFSIRFTWYQSSDLNNVCVKKFLLK